MLRVAAVEELVEVDVRGIGAGLADDLLRRVDHRRRPAHVDVVVADAGAEHLSHVLADESAKAAPLLAQGCKSTMKSCPRFRDYLDKPCKAGEADACKAAEVMNTAIMGPAAAPKK